MSAMSPARSGSTSGSASASLNATVAPAVQASPSDRYDKKAHAGVKRRAAIAPQPAPVVAISHLGTGPTSATTSWRIRSLMAVAWTYTPSVEFRTIGVAASSGSEQRAPDRTGGGGRKECGCSLESQK